ncbi:MAG TPA: hypothetical protein VMU16_09775 [Candidatus Binataceae bacterium]|nr:hypothetical protein [Candidatus Binataceae bacterium]
MERVEVVCGNVFVLRTKQLGPNCWCCDLYERDEISAENELFLLEDFGESENEAIAMALSDAHECNQIEHHHH